MVKFFDPKMPARIRYGHRLPHWQQDSCVLFVTFRLADSLPSEKLKMFRELREGFLKRHPKPWSVDVHDRFQELLPESVDKWIDAGYGSCLLADSDVREIVAEALRFNDAKRYRLHFGVIMPNHVHLLMSPYEDMESIIRSLKEYTTRRVNETTGRKGKLWADDWFDCLVRSSSRLADYYEYMLHNPDRLPPGSYSILRAESK